LWLSTAKRKTQGRARAWLGSKGRFGSEGYAVEELVAELGAAFLCADLELALEPREDHASYIATWLKVLAADNRAVFTAAAHAQRATEFINSRATAAAQVNSTCGVM